MKLNVRDKTLKSSADLYLPQRFDGRPLVQGRPGAGIQKTEPQPKMQAKEPRPQAPSGPKGVEILGQLSEQHKEILCSPALEFYAALQREFNPRRLAAAASAKRAPASHRPRRNAGLFCPKRGRSGKGTGRCLPVPEDLQDRRVEITGPVDRKMVINALNSGANCYMADFEDAHSPTWEGTLDGPNQCARRGARADGISPAPKASATS